MGPDRADEPDPDLDLAIYSLGDCVQRDGHPLIDMDLERGPDCFFTRFLPASFIVDRQNFAGCSHHRHLFFRGVVSYIRNQLSLFTGLVGGIGYGTIPCILAARYLYPADSPLSPYLDIGRELLGGLPFILPNITILEERLWLAFMNIVPYVILGWLAFVWAKDEMWRGILAGLWASLFLQQGPIHSPLYFARCWSLFPGSGRFGSLCRRSYSRVTLRRSAGLRGCSLQRCGSECLNYVPLR